MYNFFGIGFSGLAVALFTGIIGGFGVDLFWDFFVVWVRGFRRVVGGFAGGFISRVGRS